MYQYKIKFVLTLVNIDLMLAEEELGFGANAFTKRACKMSDVHMIWLSTSSIPEILCH